MLFLPCIFFSDFTLSWVHKQYICCDKNLNKVWSCPIFLFPTVRSCEHILISLSVELQFMWNEKTIVRQKGACLVSWHREIRSLKRIGPSSNKPRRLRAQSIRTSLWICHAWDKQKGCRTVSLNVQPRYEFFSDLTLFCRSNIFLYQKHHTPTRATRRNCRLLHPLTSQACKRLAGSRQPSIRPSIQTLQMVNTHVLLVGHNVNTSEGWSYSYTSNDAWHFSINRFVSSKNPRNTKMNTLPQVQHHRTNHVFFRDAVHNPGVVIWVPSPPKTSLVIWGTLSLNVQNLCASVGHNVLKILKNTKGLWCHTWFLRLNIYLYRHHLPEWNTSLTCC